MVEGAQHRAKRVAVGDAFRTSLIGLLSFRGRAGRVEASIYLAAIAVTWIAFVPSYEWMLVFAEPFGGYPLWFRVLVPVLLYLAISTLWRRVRDLQWWRISIALPVLVFALPYLVIVLMLVPSMLRGDTYAEAMRGASQDGAIQIAVTMAGKFSPSFAMIATLPFLFFRGRTRGPNSPEVSK